MDGFDGFFSVANAVYSKLRELMSEKVAVNELESLYLSFDKCPRDDFPQQFIIYSTMSRSVTLIRRPALPSEESHLQLREQICLAEVAAGESQVWSSTASPI